MLFAVAVFAGTIFYVDLPPKEFQVKNNETSKKPKPSTTIVSTSTASSISTTSTTELSTARVSSTTTLATTATSSLLNKEGSFHYKIK